jgi:hypothetical protein
LAAVRDPWRTLLMHYAVLEDLESTSEELKERVVTSVARMKAAVSNLISLLAAADALPPQYLVVVNFSSFDLDDSDTLRRLKILKLCRLQEKRSNQEIAKATREIDEIVQRFSKDGKLETPDTQLIWIQDFVDKATHSFDEKWNSMPITYDASEFSDFFIQEAEHSIGHTLMSHFLRSTNPDPMRFSDLTETIVAHLNFQERPKALVVNALVSSVIGPRFVPVIPFDGHGTTDDDVIALALTLISHTDPILILAEIAARIGDGDAAAAVQAALDALATITSSAKALLVFAHEFTQPDYLQSTEIDVRTAIASKLGLG